MTGGLLTMGLPDLLLAEGLGGPPAAAAAPATGGLLALGMPGLLLTGGLGNAPFVVTTTNAPDPAETAWTLGHGGATWDGTIARGFALTLATQLTNNGLPVAFSPSDALDAAAWPGGGGPAVFAPSAAWDAADGGAPLGRVLLTIPASATAGLDAASYRLRLGVTSAATGLRSLCYDGAIVVRDAPAATSYGPILCTYEDCKRQFDQLDALANAQNDSSGFLDVRAEVSDLVRRRLVLEYDPYPGFTRTRQATPDPILGFDVLTPAAAIPTPAQLSGYLDAGGLVDERKLRVHAARLVVAEVLERQMAATGQPYQAEADRFRQRAEMDWRWYQAQIDANADGTPDLLYQPRARTVILLPAGTAP